MFTLQLFGGCTLVADGDAITGRAVQRRRLALLAVLASSSTTGVSRDKLLAYFWPDEDRERARHFLSDSLFTLRKALGKDVLLTAGDDVRVNTDVLDADVARFEKLVAGGDLAGAAVLYRGPFLDGFFVSDAPEFERWTEVERDRLARRYAWCLEQLATGREAAEDWSEAAEWWRRLAAHDPYSSRVALRTMRALERSGDAAGALRHAQTHQNLVREELGLESDPAIRAVADRLRVRPAASSPPRPSQPVPDVSPRSETSVRFVASPVARANGSVPHGLDDAADAAVADTPASSSRAEPTTARRLTRRGTFVGATLVAVLVLAIPAIRTQRLPELAAGPADRPNAPVASAGSVRNDTSIRQTQRDRARELYTQGRYTLTRGQFDPEIHARALRLFNQATQLDPSFALAYAGIADVYNHADDPVRAKEAALTAVRLDSSLAEAYTSLAYVLANYEHRWDDADSALKRAISRNPRYVLAYLRRANMLAAQGRMDEAVASVESAREIQPESFVVLLNRGFMAELAGRPDTAIAHYQTALGLEPDRVDAREMLSRAYWAQERYVEAQQMMRSIGNLAGVAEMSGNRDTMAQLAPVLAASSDNHTVMKAALMYIRLERRDDAFKLLEQLYRRRYNLLALALRKQPALSLRSDPRYGRLLEKMNLK